MSNANAPDSSPPKKVLRTVTPPYSGRPDWEMGLIGWLYLLGLAIILLPILPILLALWVLDRLFRIVTPPRI